ncbi:MAG: hypothetical protein LQ352_002404 [Teloschistes flavicans]|nr:MAG: hypothetical protein LQ352_002404 [Teloschistes flavicans]
MEHVEGILFAVRDKYFSIGAPCRIKSDSNARDNKVPELLESMLMVPFSHKQAMWTSIAQDLNTPWRAVEHQHWMIGQEDMATLAGARMLHGDRSSRDSEVSGTRRQPLLPQMSGPSTTYNTGSASTYHRLSGGTGGRMPPLPGPPTTNGVSAPRFSAGGEETGLGFYRGNRKQRGSGGQLPSLGEMTSGVPAWAAHIDDRYYEEDEEEDDLKEEAEDPEMKQEP